MGAALKVLIGLVLIVIGLGLFYDSISAFLPIHVKWLDNFLVVVTGIIPIFFILIGLLIVWLEVDEIKMEKELKKEESKKGEAKKEEPKSKKESKK